VNRFFEDADIQEIVTKLGDKARAFEGKTILMTGAAGFLGTYFKATFALLNQSKLTRPCKVIALDNLITSAHKDAASAESSDDQNIKFVQHDIIKPFEPNVKVDFILHAAGIASPHYYRAFPLETLDVAIAGTRNMLELASRDKAKILFFSSSEIYGDPDPKYVPTPESYRGNVSCLGPRACYDESKRVGETLCRIYNTQFRAETKMVRPFNVFGPGMKENDYRVLPNFASRIVAEKPLSVYGDGSQTRTFCYITDAINGFLRVLIDGHPGEPYNIGNPKPEISMIDLVKHIERALERDVPLHLMDYPDSYPGDEPQRRCPDIGKARIHVGYEPTVEFSDGLKRYLRWALDTYKGIQ
jgi:UDP-glucuronate decarboxylase